MADLRCIGSRFSRIHIIESILDPSRTIVPGFGTFVIALKNGKTVNGVKVAESETMVRPTNSSICSHSC